MDPGGDTSALAGNATRRAGRARHRGDGGALGAVHVVVPAVRRAREPHRYRQLRPTGHRARRLRAVRARTGDVRGHGRSPHPAGHGHHRGRVLRGALHVPARGPPSPRPYRRAHPRPVDVRARRGRSRVGRRLGGVERDRGRQGSRPSNGFGGPPPCRRLQPHSRAAREPSAGAPSSSVFTTWSRPTPPASSGPCRSGSRSRSAHWVSRSSPRPSGGCTTARRRTGGALPARSSPGSPIPVPVPAVTRSA